jgi:hypothetical protein
VDAEVSFFAVQFKSIKNFNAVNLNQLLIINKAPFEGDIISLEELKF